MNSRRRFSPLAATLLAAAALHGVGLGALPARADQDDDAERVPSNAGDVYSPIERTFQRQQLLPGGPVARLPQFGPAVPKPEGPVLLDDLKERLRYDDPFLRDMKVDLYLRTGYLDRHNSDASVSQAWAGGSALGFRSGWHDDWLQLIGEELMPGSPFETSQVSGRVAASYHDATILAALSENGKGADLNGPFGSFPAYTVLDQLNFNDAGETTVVVGAAYDFSRIITDGLKFQMRYGKGFNVIDPATGASQSRQNEINFETEYQPMSGPLENLHVQLFYSGVRLPDNPPGQENQPQVRGVVTYLVPLL